MDIELTINEIIELFSAYTEDMTDNNGNILDKRCIKEEQLGVGSELRRNLRTLLKHNLHNT